MNRVAPGARPTGTLAAGPSGTRILVEENHDLPIVRVTLTLLTGGADDPSGPLGREGLAYFASELCCRGAGGRSREEIDEAFEALGGDLAVSVDADAVTFDVEVLSEHLAPALALLCDVLLRPDLLPVEAEKLRREMHAALDDLRDEDASLTRRFFSRALYGDLPYGKPLGGTAASIDRLGAGEARRWLERAVIGGNLIVAAAGDVEERRFHRLVERLGVLRRGAPTLAPIPRAPFPRGPRLVLVDKPERSQSTLLIGQPAVRRADPDYLPLVVGTTAFGGMFTSRLMREVRVKRGLSYGATASISQGRGPRAVSMMMAPSLAQTAETIALALDLWRDFVERAPDDDELEFAKEHLAQSFAFQIATPEDRVDLRVGVEICGLPADFLETLVPAIRAVTPAEVKAAIARNLDPRDLLVTVVATASETLPLLRKAKLFPRDAIEVVPYDAY